MFNADEALLKLNEDSDEENASLIQNENQFMKSSEIISDQIVNLETEPDK